MTGTTTGTATVLGATGGTGAALVRELLARGYDVRAVSRPGRVPDDAQDAGAGTGRVEGVAADATDPEQVRAAAAGAAVVFHAAQPAYSRWPQEFPAMTDAITAGTAAAGARLVMADNLYMYGPHDGPLAEDLPYAAQGRKGRVRAAMARSLLQAHEQGRLQVALARSSDYYGPGGLNTNAGERVFGAALAGRRVQLLGRLDQPHSWSYLPDMARAMVTLAEHDEAYGRAWHLPVAPPITGAAFLGLVSAAAGTEPKHGTVPRPVLRALGLVNPTIRELPEMLYTAEHPYVVDDGAYRATFGPFTSTPHADAVRDTTEWFRRRRTVAAAA